MMEIPESRGIQGRQRIKKMKIFRRKMMMKSGRKKLKTQSR